MSHLSTIVPGAPGEPPRNLLPDGVMRALIADELDRIRVVLEEMGMQLCSDSGIVVGHMNVLQAVDEVCQRNENLARTLRSHDMVAEANQITLESLRLRLQDEILERLAEQTIAGDPTDDETWHEF